MMKNKEQIFCIISTDRHRDDIVYLYRGNYEEAKEYAEKLFKKEFKNYSGESKEFDGNLKYYISALDGDYSISIYIPEILNGGSFFSSQP